MKKPKISFRIIGDSGPLSLTWVPGPLGDAQDAKRGKGVGFFSTSGELLGIEFDDVAVSKDSQSLEFKNYIVEIKVTNKKIEYEVTQKNKVSTRKKTTKKSAA